MAGDRSLKGSTTRRSSGFFLTREYPCLERNMKIAAARSTTPQKVPTTMPTIWATDKPAPL